MAVGGSGTWNPSGNSSYNSNGTYTIPKGSNFKKYKVTQESYSGSFGTGKVIAPVDTSSSSGNERFYVMALTDVDGGQTETYYCWYAAAYLNMNDYASTTSTAFGQGEQNTINMIAKWNSSSYGAQNDGMHEDMWGVSAVNNRTWNGSSGWYIPSRDEWAAFADQLNITIGNYSSKGLSIGQWTSSQRKNNHAFGVYFGGGYISSYNVNSGYYVRLGTTF